MKNKTLNFNGKNIVFLNKDGVYYVAIKPICEALEVNYNRAAQNLREDEILAPKVAKQQLLVPEDTQLRLMICLPEQYIYGWLFSINSKSEALKKYKIECYDVLYNHFHGAITGRKELLSKRISVDAKIHNLKKELRQSDEKYQQLHDLQQKRKRLSGELNSADNEFINQTKLF